MRVDLPGVHRVKVKKRDGSLVFYYYAWRGGPRLASEPGSPEFLASYQAAHANRRQPKGDTFHSVIVAYKAARDGFLKLRDRTQADYLKILAKIEIAFGDLPLEALEELAVTKVLLDWRNELAAASPRQADYAWAVLMRLISFARGRDMTTYRLPEQVERLYESDRSDKIWTDADIAAFEKVASKPLRLAIVLALETGQREGDLLKLPWSAYGIDDQGRKRITLRPSKSRNHRNKLGRQVSVPVTPRLAAALDSTPRICPVILTNLDGLPWTEDGFRSSWRKACTKAGIVGLTFHDLRGTMVTRLSKHFTPQVIAMWTGHSVRDVQNIIERYLARSSDIAIAEIAKLGRGVS